jgi:hypothetical protein
LSEVLSANSLDSVWQDLSVAVPVYSRPAELLHLLQSIYRLKLVPSEVVLCEDNSPERDLISSIAREWTPFMAARGCDVRYFENDSTLGYDGNVRSLFEKSTRTWVMLLGNDDVLLPGACERVREFTQRHTDIMMISRAFVRFTDDPALSDSISRLSQGDHVFSRSNSSSGILFRSTAFFGGLIANRLWAVSEATNAYDGTLYYQTYLAARAFTGAGIGYIAAPIVGARIGNQPLFGAAASEKAVHVSGSYTPRGRAAMWRGVLRICADVEAATGCRILPGVRRELDKRQSFHVFEMMARQGRGAVLQTAEEFWNLGLMRHLMPWALFFWSIAFGRRSVWLFDLARERLQK